MYVFITLFFIFHNIYKVSIKVYFMSPVPNYVPSPQLCPHLFLSPLLSFLIHSFFLTPKKVIIIIYIYISNNIKRITEYSITN